MERPEAGTSELGKSVVTAGSRAAEPERVVVGTDPAAHEPVIALDAMGGDNMPRAAVEGAIKAHLAGAKVVLVGDENVLKPELANLGGVDLEIVHASDVISMDEHATDVRRRRDSSVMVGMRLVKDGRADACVSMGHSGATMAAALLVLGRLSGVDRPAILANIPKADGFVALLDAGANADCRPEWLRQFALMGSAYVERVWGVERPKVGLMSIGEEPHKGNELVREAHGLLVATGGLNFHGNVEGRDLFSGLVDVVVTDGFTGNVILKLAEGEARTLFGWVRDALMSDLRSKVGGLLVKPALRRVAERMDPAEYGAQPLLGVDGYAFIGHGSADARAVASAVRTARQAVRSGALGHLRNALEGAAVSVSG
ncbi:MAG: phosphate acyltransferase PlsX [Trueperaceae bacterium]|jgi:glycerol-3-phosphate acyltransferase PlsX